MGAEGHLTAGSPAPSKVVQDPRSIAATLETLVNAPDVNIDSIWALVDPLQASAAGIGPRPGHSPPMTSQPLWTDQAVSREMALVGGPPLHAAFAPPATFPSPGSSWFHPYWGPHLAMLPPYAGGPSTGNAREGGAHPRGGPAREPLSEARGATRPKDSTSQKMEAKGATRWPCTPPRALGGGTWTYRVGTP